MKFKREIEAITQISELSYVEVGSADIIDALSIVENRLGEKYNTVLLTLELLTNYDMGESYYTEHSLDDDCEYQEILEKSCDYILSNEDKIDLSLFEVK